MAVRRPQVRQRGATLDMSPIQRALKKLTSEGRQRSRMGKKVAGRKSPRRRIVSPSKKRLRALRLPTY
jgi:hypothetical protein